MIPATTLAAWVQLFDSISTTRQLLRRLIDDGNLRDEVGFDQPRLSNRLDLTHGQVLAAIESLEVVAKAVSVEVLRDSQARK